VNLAKCSIFIIVDSDLIKEQKRKDLLGLLGAMENTMEYTVSVYYVVAPILNFAIDYASILTLSNATYFLRVLRLILPPSLPHTRKTCVKKLQVFIG
jgi:hypothetical protein